LVVSKQNINLQPTSNVKRNNVIRIILLSLFGGKHIFMEKDSKVSVPAQFRKINTTYFKFTYIFKKITG
jgi:hypothetical protein